MSFPLGEFRILFPAFADVDDAVVEAVAGLAECYLPRGKSCSDCAGQLWMLIVAHMLKLRSDESSGGGGVGAVTSASVGSVSVSFATAPIGNSAQAAWFAITPYGLQFLALRKRCYGLPRYVGGSPASRPWR